MQKIILGLIAVTLSFGMAASAQAQNGQGLQMNKPEVSAAKQVPTTMGYPRLATSSEAVQAAIKTMQAEREAFMERVTASKEEAVANRVQLKEELKTKLQAVKDEAKKKAVERLDENFSKINSNFVEKWTNAVTRVDASLAKLVGASNASSTATSTADLSLLNSAVFEANAKIAAAKVALESQAKKVYTITVSTEENLKMDVSSVREALNNDLKAVKELVQAAHASVVNVLVEFNKIK